MRLARFAISRLQYPNTYVSFLSVSQARVAHLKHFGLAATVTTVDRYSGQLELLFERVDLVSDLCKSCLRRYDVDAYMLVMEGH